MANYYEASMGDEHENLEAPLSHEEYIEQKESLLPAIEIGEKVKRLSENPDFISIFMEGYFSAEPQRLASLLASGKLPEKNKENIIKDFDGIARCRSFLQAFADNAHQARIELANLEAAREEAILEEAGEVVQ